MSGFKREEFEVFGKKIFFNWASFSPAPSSAVKKVKEMADSVHYFSDNDVSALWEQQSGELRKEASRLLNADADEIVCAGSSTTQGLQIAMNCINPSRGENIVTDSIEFPTAGFEGARWKKRGVEQRIAQCGDGKVEAERFDRLIDEHTSAVLISSVNWLNGYRADLKEIAKITHESGGYLVVDAVQQMGAGNIDVRKNDVDFVAAGGQKWMFSPFGSAVLFVNQRNFDRLAVPYPSLNNTKKPEKGWPAYFADESNDPFEEREAVGTAKRFEYGGWMNHTGIAAHAVSLQLLNELNINNVEKRIYQLYEYASEKIEGIGGKIISPSEKTERSSILTFRLKDNWREHFEIVAKLATRGFALSCRGAGGIGGIRMSIHCFNEEEDVDKLIPELKRFI
ncbi:MAG: aminotransferase class V-fold PLP-dependent enzyme [Thermoplasmata archaeon]|jgi:selenocysteine lyase/cysteine desulfurase|nr:aminotransferase class V-fold PLP-dependent enzyme [Candidatus Sysuiplasma jiujiangense]MBX8640780.1 aminotransferase class V-fold PLP-dependent enzyme [Candidatus Sysuiplasma jiujiangense]MBX8641372.1 aminotransferase class V-fold PLP-dependent enzyme [Candidatus Sysuiplasma jiujiangense]